MPTLFCEEHGREHEAEAARNQERFRHAGETVVLVKGTLLSGPWHCDRCNVVLRKGRPATLLSSYPCWVATSMSEYDFSYERQYFAVEKADIAVYGAAWPVVMLPNSGCPARRPRRQQPLCALDLKKPNRTEPTE